MKRRRNLLPALAFCLAPTLLASPPIQSPAPPSSRGHSIPFQLFGNLIYVPVRANDSAPLWFILDSGADSFVLDERRAKALHLKLEGGDQVQGIGEDSVKIAFARGVSLRLGDVELKQRRLVVYPFANLEHVTGHAIDGILGAGVFERFVVEIDYAAQTVTLHEPQSYRYEGQGESLPIAIDGSLPFVRAKIALPGRAVLEGKVLIDTGGNTALGLNRPFVDRHKLLETLPRTLPTREVGASGQANGRLGRVEALQLGRLVFATPVVGFSQATKGATSSAGNDGLIGGAALRRLKVILDYSRKRVILEPNEQFAEPFETGMSGALLTAEGEDLRSFTIYQILEPSAAASAGLLAGDVLTAIDGKPAAELTLEQIAQMFKLEGRSVRLSVRRGEQTLQVEIQLRRLL